MADEARIVARLPRAPRDKIFMDWDLVYGNPVRDVNTQKKSLTSGDFTHTDPKATRKIGMRNKEKERTYIVFFYNIGQAIRIMITTNGFFKIDTKNVDLEECERVKVIGNLNNGVNPHT